VVKQYGMAIVAKVVGGFKVKVGEKQDMVVVKVVEEFKVEVGEK